MKGVTARPRLCRGVVYTWRWGCMLVAAVLALLLSATSAHADEAPDELFVGATRALQEGRAGDAIVSFEALADRGVVDPVASYDRGLAYASRIRLGAEVPGDLGRAAHGFEEARELSSDPKLVADAGHALEVVRSEVARRRARAGQPVEVDYGRSLGRAVANLVPEDAWALLSVIASLTLTAGLFLRWLSRGPRLRANGGVASGIAAPALALTVAMTLASRHDRHDLHEAVVVASDARPLDGRALTIAGATPLPEGARVEVIDTSGAVARVRFGASDVRVATATLREMARRD
jgi:hypothetical protein